LINIDYLVILLQQSTFDTYFSKEEQDDGMQNNHCNGW